ncbi:MAG: UDP-N-acetylglucosamine 1-carboxyvinyltransferase [Oscillospiraceae bacterium]|nr:UDP-N-acetylglucosamine 1-carboxyvinyltransferase [Oscillospiraceae bacterium]
MEALAITGGVRLNGTIKVQGAKNSVLPILAATIINGGESIIHNCPRLRDVEASLKVLEHLGCSAERRGGTVIINSQNMTGGDIPTELMREMRSSVIFLGAILARRGSAVIAYPGGCELGARPIDLHLAALRRMGARIREEQGYIICQSDGLTGADINLSFPSVGATENIMLAATAASGVTVINNAAREPEIWDMQQFLRCMGAEVSGAGTPVITIKGRAPLKNAEHTVISDRIVAATWLSCVASAGGEVVLQGVIPEHYSTVTDILSAAGCHIENGRDFTYIKSNGELRAVRPVVTRPYPGFPTDAQAPVMAALLKASGTTVFVENIFENRYRHVPELKRMGADVKIEGRVAMVCSVAELHGAAVRCTDLRGGAAMAVAALGARGTSFITDLHHINRGYEDFAGALKSLGARAELINGG